MTEPSQKRKANSTMNTKKQGEHRTTLEHLRDMARKRQGCAIELSDTSTSSKGENTLIVELDREYSTGEKAEILALIYDSGYFRDYKIVFEVVDDYYERWQI